MTIDTPAAVIAKRYTASGKFEAELEVAILRHMEHHVARAIDTERDACAAIVAIGHKEGWTHAQIIDEIRARSSANKPFTPKF